MKWRLASLPMAIEPTDRNDLESRWLRNEHELNRITSMGGLDRELHAGRQEALESEQDAIEFELGRTARDGARRWSGLP
jgi:hypothetical protein